MAAIQKEREQRENDKEEIQYEVTVDDGEQSEKTIETGGTTPLQFVEADLEAVERCINEEIS